MFVQNMPYLAVAMVVAREKTSKKSIFFKFHETSKYHIFRKLIFSSCLKMFIDFFKGLTDISKSWNLNKKICNNHKLLRFEIQNNQKFHFFQKLQVLKVESYICSIVIGQRLHRGCRPLTKGERASKWILSSWESFRGSWLVLIGNSHGLRGNWEGLRSS